MIGVPPGCTIGVKPAQVRDKPKKPKKDKPRRPDEMKDADKIAWADAVADAPGMLMGRDPHTGRFFSLKGRGN